MEKYEAVIFDCDGVLIESWNSTCYYFNRILGEVGLPPMTDEQEEYAFIHSVAETLDMLIPDRLRQAAEMSKSRITAKDLLPRLALQPGIAELLETLAGLGLPMAVDTNGGHEALHILESLNILDYFSLVVTAEDVERAKPAPDGVKRILAQWGLPAERAVFVGDSMVDMLTAMASGVAFWAFRNRALEADLHLESFQELYGNPARYFAKTAREAS